MCVIIVFFGLLLNTLQDCTGERRITNGKPVKESKRYVAYLLKAPKSPHQYDAWLCGGAIVSPLYIVTSAACIEDLQYMYAIAGYNKYVRSKDILTDECTKNKKKKVVLTCIPKAYNLVYEKVEVWSKIDIGVVKVESPYDFTDKSFETQCSHIPDQITINYEPKYQEPGIDAMVFGWGHAEIWRQTSDTTDYNQRELHYTTTLITEKKVCKDVYKNNPAMIPLIDNYMICTNNTGNIDETGKLILTSKPTAQGCFPNSHQEGKVVAFNGEEHCVNITKRTRRHGICQNDHGGPLVTWVGSHEVLIGVASVFRINDEFKCQGPYLFTSTQCNGAFLDCIINGEQPSGRRSICDMPPKERGFEFVRRTISWRNHPDGPADNEKIRLRPLLPIRQG